MSKLVFGDGEQIGVYDNGEVIRLESGAISRYRSYAETRRTNDEWKVSGAGASFRGDAEKFDARAETVQAAINGVDWDGDKVVYAYSVNGSSGIYRKDITDEKLAEEHIFSSQREEILSVHVSGGLIAVTVRSDDVTSQVGTIDMRTSELRTYTDGDSRDANARFSLRRPMTMLFDSAGVGRTAGGEFSGKYAPASLYELRPDTLALEERLSDGKNSYIKPFEDREGNLYCIRRPNRERQGGSLISDILLFPFRILKAVFGFLQAFTMLFGGTSLTSASAQGENPTRDRTRNAKEIFVDGKRVEIAKAEKQNRRFKDREYGFIPASWKLVRMGEKEEVLVSGVCDYAFGDDGTLYFTDGRHIWLRREGKDTKIATCSCCLTLAVQTASETPQDDFF